MGRDEEWTVNNWFVYMKHGHPEADEDDEDGHTYDGWSGEWMLQRTIDSVPLDLNVDPSSFGWWTGLELDLELEVSII